MCDKNRKRPASDTCLETLKRFKQSEDPVSTSQNTPALSQTCDDNRNQPIAEFGDSTLKIPSQSVFYSKKMSLQPEELLLFTPARRTNCFKTCFINSKTLIKYEFKCKRY